MADALTADTGMERKRMNWQVSMISCRSYRPFLVFQQKSWTQRMTWPRIAEIALELFESEWDNVRHFEASVLWTDAFNSVAANNLSDLEWFLLLWPDRINCKHIRPTSNLQTTWTTNQVVFEHVWLFPLSCRLEPDSHRFPIFYCMKTIKFIESSYPWDL